MSNSQPLPDCAQVGRAVLLEQAQALVEVARALDGPFSHAVELMAAVPGHLVVAGVGKSGLVGRKIAATLSSTGTPAFWMHPTEAFHGDLGSVTMRDLALLISYSGETEELTRLVPALRDQGVSLVAMTGRPGSTLARAADVHLNVAVARETCPHNLAPTTSTTVTLALGDALAIALMQRKGFAPEDFARFHPGGTLGRRLARVGQVMHVEGLPTVAPGTDIVSTVRMMTAGRMGMAVITSPENRVLGVMTDGDVRRAFERALAAEGAALTAADVMTLAPVTIDENARVADARARMERHQIKAMPVTDDAGRLLGILSWADTA
jgi:arabinose-5-phosphate isomerase